MATLYYVHDPMCSWCWAFRPSLIVLLEELTKQINVVRLLGGLAPDSDVPMSGETRAYVQSNWQAVEQQVPETKFNYDFWVKCNPRRSTYPACRAVIAARQQGDEFDPAMTFVIQQAYYLQARNPSDTSNLIELAEGLGLDKNKFSVDIQSPDTDEILRQEIKQSRRLGLNSFPGLLLVNGDKQVRIEPDYINPEVMLNKVKVHY
ncbi:MAG: DsbA family protein [Proteobacteria bacterium]|nr:DsbA family protein [Pseudomonadota bacterium]